MSRTVLTVASLQPRVCQRHRDRSLDCKWFAFLELLTGVGRLAVYRQHEKRQKLKHDTPSCHTHSNGTHFRMRIRIASAAFGGFSRRSINERSVIHKCRLNLRRPAVSTSGHASMASMGRLQTDHAQHLRSSRVRTLICASEGQSQDCWCLWKTTGSGCLRCSLERDPRSTSANLQHARWSTGVF